MCTFHDETAVTVCDVAIGRVRSDLEGTFLGAVTFTHVDGKGTLVEVDPTVEPARFDAAIRLAIAAAQVPASGDSAPPE